MNLQLLHAGARSRVSFAVLLYDVYARHLAILCDRYIEEGKRAIACLYIYPAQILEGTTSLGVHYG